jgi:cobalamin biosynthesis Co2+ chelatase CbiK
MGFRKLMLPTLMATMSACQSPTSFPNGYEYLTANKFGNPYFAQMKVGNTLKNINDDLPQLLELLRNSKMVPKRKVNPSYVIYLQTGSSSPSQAMSIHLDNEGFGEFQLHRHTAYFLCRELPSFSASAFQRSTILLENRR